MPTAGALEGQLNNKRDKDTQKKLIGKWEKITDILKEGERK